MERNIILTGFMGTGKSTVGRKLAARLGHKFVDTDLLIEREEGTSITRIFADKGEPYFREREKQMIDRVCSEGGTVIATGGGAMMSEANVARMKGSGTVICLTATPDIILERVRKNSDRPLLQEKDPFTKIRTLLAARAEAYARADVAIDTSHLGVDEVVEAIVVTLRENTAR
jgi:shikimate kinase